MKVRVLLLSALLTGSLTAQERPNIIFLLADDLGIGDVGIYNQNARAELGLPAIATPNMDALAAQGVRFTNMHSNPMCGPSRSTLICGFHQGHAKVDRNQSKNNAIQPGDHEKSWASLLREADYTTGLFGRWHLRGFNIDTLTVFDINSTPLGKGFDELWNNAGNGGGYRMSHAFIDNDDGDGILENTDTIAVPRPASSDPADDWALANGGLGVAPEYEVLTSTKKALDFLDANLGTNEPFMAFIPIFATHTDTDEVPNEGDYAGLGYPRSEANYAAAVASVDEALGRLMDKLRDPNSDGDESDSAVDRTIIVFTSDNGNQSASHSISYFGSTRVYRDDGDGIVESSDFVTLRGEKFEVYEGGTNAPFIIQWTGNPDIVPGSVYERLATFSDWVPTVAELVGGEIPLGVDGVSFLADLTGGISERPDFRIHSSQNGWSVAMGEWKLVNSAGLKLYHLPTDPGENAPVSNRSDTVNALQTLAIAEGITSDVNLTGADSNTWFSQYKDWSPATGSTDFYAAPNWSGGISSTLYPNSGGSATAHWNTGPAANWIASMDNADATPEEISVSGSATILALELASARSKMKLTLESGVDFEIHNGGRLHSGGHLALNGATLRTQRDIEVLPNAILSGAGTVTGNQQWLTGIAEFANQGLLEPHVINAGIFAPDKEIGATPPPSPPPGNPASFILFENFDTLSNGSLNGQNSWSAPPLATVVANPDDGGKALQVAGTGSLGVAYKALGSLAIANGTTGTLFLRVKPTDSVEHATGLSDQASPTTWSSYEVQLNWKNSRSLAARSGSTETNVAAFTSGEWQNIWVVVDHTSDTYEVYASSHSDSGPVDGSNLLFRNNSAGALNTFLTMVSSAAGSDLLMDDIYLDPTHVNLQVPQGLTLPESEADPSPLGTFTIEGRYTQKASGVLALDLAGPDNSNPSSPEYDSLAVSDTANLDGTIEVTLTEGFLPQVGDSFTILKSGAISGRFDHSGDTVISKDGSTTFRIHYSATTVVLVVPPPLVQPVASIITDGNGDEFLSVTYRRVAGGSSNDGVNYTANGIVYTVEHNDDLDSPWSSGSVTAAGLPLDNGDGTETVTVLLTTPLTGSGRQFLRLRVTTP